MVSRTLTSRVLDLKEFEVLVTALTMVPRQTGGNFVLRDTK